MVTTDALLRVEGLEVSYGAVRAVRGVDLTVKRGEVVALLGVNGAGKTSILNALIGVVPSTARTICFDGTEIRGWVPERVVRKGMALCPEGRRIFASLSVRENLRLAGGFISSSEYGQRESELLELFPVLRDKIGQAGGHLSGGQQQQLAIARALMRQPSLLLLDEPSLGLAPKIVSDVFGLVEELSRRGVTVLIVEQNAERTLALCDRAYVLQGGQIALSGKREELNAADIEAVYLGLPFDQAVVEHEVEGRA